MTDTTTNQEGADALQAIKIFGMQWMDYFASVQQLAADYVRLQQRVAELEEENRKLKEDDEQLRKADEWSSRLTYDNVVELIANNEDAAQRDISRKVFEPLLKKEQVRQLRRDIKKRVKELNDADEEQQPMETVIPTELAESELWQKATDTGLVDANGQPTVSRPEAALLADYLARRIGLANKWKVFEQAWHRNNMRSDYNTALEQKKSLAFQDKLKDIFE